MSISSIVESDAVAKMRSGAAYLPLVPELNALRDRAKGLCHRHNAALDPREREAILAELLGPTADAPYLEPPFYCDYGFNISAGVKLYMNHGCVLLDCGRIVMGDHVMLGPAVQIYTVNHPLDVVTRRAGYEYTAAVHIGDNVWIGGGAILCPGVSIGENTVIGAGSVVTRSVPPNVVAVGNPCKVLRRLDAAAVDGDGDFDA
jgi:maltose O-acetyltransferase